MTPTRMMAPESACEQSQGAMEIRRFVARLIAQVEISMGNVALTFPGKLWGLKRAKTL